MNNRDAAYTARRIACPRCGAVRFADCVDQTGQELARSHRERIAAARTAPKITPGQIEALRKLHVDPTRYLEPGTRNALLRHGLITSPDPRTPPQGAWGRVPKRRHLLTDAGRAAIGVVTTSAEPATRDATTGAAP